MAGSPFRGQQATVSGFRRILAAWRALAGRQQAAGAAALALLATMFLPWYSTSSPVSRVVNGHLQATTAGATKSALFVFSWVEAAVLVVCLAVLSMLFARGERRPFHLPLGDGAMLTLAGVWASLLVAWRFFDKPDLGRGVAVGTHWGIFFALSAALALAYAGNRERLVHRPEPAVAGSRRRSGRQAPGAEVRLPDQRPHLEETEVLGTEPTDRLDPRGL